MENTDWILTFTGKKFFPLQPTKDDIDILDIAHALSNLCRFTGHCRDFYSVAEHSVLVAERIWMKTDDKRSALMGLLHDASEAYLIDVARPVKQSDEFEFYRKIEKQLQNQIYQKYGVNGFFDDDVKEADEHLLRVEAFRLMPKHPEWSLTQKEIETTSIISCWTPVWSKHKFLEAFEYYQKENGVKDHDTK